MIIKYMYIYEYCPVYNFVFVCTYIPIWCLCMCCIIRVVCIYFIDYLFATMDIQYYCYVAHSTPLHIAVPNHKHTFAYIVSRRRGNAPLQHQSELVRCNYRSNINRTLLFKVVQQNDISPSDRHASMYIVDKNRAQGWLLVHLNKLFYFHFLMYSRSVCICKFYCAIVYYVYVYFIYEYILI